MSAGCADCGSSALVPLVPDSSGGATCLDCGWVDPGARRQQMARAMARKWAKIERSVLAFRKNQALANTP